MHDQSAKLWYVRLRKSFYSLESKFDVIWSWHGADVSFELNLPVGQGSWAWLVWISVVYILCIDLIGLHNLLLAERQTLFPWRPWNLRVKSRLHRQLCYIVDPLGPSKKSGEGGKKAIMYISH